ncbi:leucine-rich repeat-containing protein 73-like [Gigantopelta aegis]|uniref:leucine-rich repeat-containing protein 73-like n=1 Tax=Gigantopelta aegis TaxID=1735272 RepID=UPI001B88C274|nr:leucine-rich repeat-containing protein 73-like [Gigantopelta aegis]
MLLSTASYTNEVLNKITVNKICDSLQDEQMRMVSLRQCKLSDTGFKRIMKHCGNSKYLLQLTLNLGILADQSRLELLGQALRRNKTLKGLFIHGNPIGDDGLKVIVQALCTNHNISTLDIGDCELGDASIHYLKPLLNPEEDKPGLTELTLSGNTNITEHGWAVLAMSISCSPCLRSLYVDYNRLGDSGASCLLIAAAASQMIEVLDLEGTNLTEKTGKLVMELIQTYPGMLKRISLVGNKVRKSTMAIIKSILKANNHSEEDTSEDDIWSTSTEVTSTEVMSSTGSSTARSTSSDQSDCSGDGTSSASSQNDTLKANDSQSKVDETETEVKDTEEKEAEDSCEELKEVPVFW